MTAAKSSGPNREQTRFGIGEWYGVPISAIPARERRELASKEPIPAKNRPPCPFQTTGESSTRCWKSGGVCTLQQYALEPKLESVVVRGGYVTTCPKRFLEGGLIYEWVGKVVLGVDAPLVIGEVGFLESTVSSDAEVGRIDNVLIRKSSGPLMWCALETQAVYFSGRSMQSDFSAIVTSRGKGLTFPTAIRRPDFRSSGPKRLMPQLQIKVPTLRRWGKKMAVVVDTAFFQSMGRMQEVQELSNCDVVWFVVDYAQAGSAVNLIKHSIHYTTLESAVEGLTAGTPVSLEVFERRIRDKAGL